MGNSDKLFVLETVKRKPGRFEVHGTGPPCGLYF